MLWCLAVSLLVLLPFALLILHRVTAEAAVSEKLDELRAAGVTVSGEEVNRLYHGHEYDPAGNAAPLYEDAIARMGADHEAMARISELVQIRPGFEPLDVETLEALARLVAAEEITISLFKEAAAHPYLRHDLDFTEGVNLLVPHVGGLRHGARLLAAEAIFAAEQQDAARAAEALQSIFRIALHLGDEPILISHLTTIAIEGIGRIALERVIDRVELSASVLTDLGETLRVLEERPRLKFAMNAEVAFGMSVYQMIEEGDVDPRELGDHFGLADLLLPLYQMSGLLARDKLIYLERMDEFVRVARLPVSGQLTAVFPADDLSVNPFHGQLVVSIILPTLDRVFETDARAVTHLRATRIALAAERYRLANGRFPEELNDLVPEYLEDLPEDPYDEDGFRFVSDADAVFVRSKEVIDLRSLESQVPIGFRLPVRKSDEK